MADRWHLLQNLSAAVEKTCHQHRDSAELPRTQIIERTRHRYEDIHRLLEKR